MSYFTPSIARARDSRSEMDAVLWASARELLEERAGVVLPDGAADGVSPVTAASPTHLLDYAAYFDLALPAAADAQGPTDIELAAIAHLRRRLPDRAEPLAALPAVPRITNFSTPDHTFEQVEQMRRWWDIEPANRMAQTRATDEEFARVEQLIGVALEYLRNVSPEQHGEVLTVVRDIVLSRPDGTNLINYSGASSCALWGAITINSETHVEWVQVYRQIVHETGHNLLFGIARDQQLVSDDPSKRRASPIRADPRPMDGIFHAAFVSAREALAFDALLIQQDKTGEFSAEDVVIIEDLLELSVLAFWDCIETLRDGAELTELGEAVLRDCESYMSENFAVEPVE